MGRTAPHLERIFLRPVPIVGVSLKLYLDLDDTATWIDRVARLGARNSALTSGDVRLFVLPSITALAATAVALRDTPVQWGAQDIHWEDRGAFTGAVSGEDLRRLGCGFVEIGHAERKRYFGETRVMIANKLSAAVRNGLTPVLCVGEPSRVTARIAADICVDELIDVIKAAGIAEESTLVIAYEPVWAIGQSRAAEADHIRGVTELVRAVLLREFPNIHLSVIYGGSAQRGTASSLGTSVDGLFLGRFAHRVEDLESIIDELQEVGAR